jgi:serine/threonine protein kinase
MSDTPDKESPGTTQQPTLCEKCGKPFAVSQKFSVASLFQTDPGEGLTRWQECCKCDSREWAHELDLPIIEEPELPPSSRRNRNEPPNAQAEVKPDGANSLNEKPAGKKSKNKKSKAAKIAASKSEVPEIKVSRTDSATGKTAQTENSEVFTGIASTQSDAAESCSSETESRQAEAFDAGTTETRNVEQSSTKLEELSEFLDNPGDSEARSIFSTEESNNSQSVMAQKVPIQDASAQIAPSRAKEQSQAAAFAPAVKGKQPDQEQVPPPQVYIIGDRYQVESVIGKGTFGPTYRAKDVATERTLCLKMVSTPISRHRRIVKRIMQEVEKAKTLNHPHIVPIYDSGIDKTGRPFYVMDLIEPGSLKNVIRQEGFLDVPEVIDIFLDVCEALFYAHEHGILHRDLKPGNILLSGKGTARRAKVSDFGIVKALPSVGSEAQEMTQSTDVFADPSCMSPEQCLGRRIDIRSDVYSLGCSMYESIVGKKVFSGPNALSIVVQHFKAIPRSFDTVMYNCDISPDVEAVVFKMLEKSPEHRYQEVSHVVEDLRLLKAHKKPTFAYQKKKGAGLNLMLPFAIKEEPDTAERLFDIVLNKKKLQDKKQHQNWNAEAKQQVAADINRLAQKGVERNLPQVKLVKTDDGPDRVIARGHGSEEIGPPPDSRPVGPVEFQQNHKSNDVIRPNMLKLPTAPGGGSGSTAQANSAHEIAHIYRASDLYPALPELFDEDRESVTEDAEEVMDSIVTVEQAKREIPEYLLQISRSSGFITLPMIVALITAVSIILIMMQMVALAP